MKAPNFNKLRKWSNFNSTIEIGKNLAIKTNLGNLLKEDIDLLSKESFSKNQKLSIINDVEEEKNDKFYDEFLNTLYDNKDKDLPKKSISNHKKHKKTHFLHKRASANLLVYNQSNFRDNVINKNTFERNYTKKNFHHMVTTFEPNIEEINKINDEEKNDKSDKSVENENSGESNINNIKSLLINKNNFKLTEMMKIEENIEQVININTNRDKTKYDVKDFEEKKDKNNNLYSEKKDKKNNLCSEKKYKNNNLYSEKKDKNNNLCSEKKVDENIKENKVKNPPNPNKGFIVDANKKKHYFFCCIPIFN